MNTIKEFFSAIGQKIAAFFAGPGGRIVKDALAVAIAEIGQAAFAVLLDLAAKRAKELEPSHISGDSKFDLVRDAVQKAAIDAGVNASRRLVNHIVETAALAAKGE
jgi:hypothetical protein